MPEPHYHQVDLHNRKYGWKVQICFRADIFKGPKTPIAALRPNPGSLDLTFEFEEIRFPTHERAVRVMLEQTPGDCQIDDMVSILMVHKLPGETKYRYDLRIGFLLDEEEPGEFTQNGRGMDVYFNPDWDHYHGKSKMEFASLVRATPDKPDMEPLKGYWRNLVRAGMDRLKTWEFPDGRYYKHVRENGRFLFWSGVGGVLD